MRHIANYYNPIRRKIVDSMNPFLRYHLKEMFNNVRAALHYQRPDMFTLIAIETTSLCNRVCSYCPESKQELRSQRFHGDMEEDIFHKIVDELSSLGYKDNVQLSNYGEPLLDQSLVSRASLVRTKLPKAHIYFGTNGDYLDSETMTKLIGAGVDEIMVTNHNSGGVFSDNMIEVISHLERNPNIRDHVHIRSGLTRLLTRGGLIEVPIPMRMDGEYCRQGQHTITINAEGNVVICCNDYLGEVVLGNVSENTLMEIWNSEYYKKLRSDMNRKEFTEEICRRCTSLTP